MSQVDRTPDSGRSYAERPREGPASTEREVVDLKAEVESWKRACLRHTDETIPDLREDLQDAREARKYFVGWAERLAASLDALVERPHDRPLAEEADETVKQWYRERLEGRHAR